MAEQGNPKPEKGAADRLAEKNATVQTAPTAGGHGPTSTLNPGGTIPESTPGAGFGSLGTGGGSTGGASSGAVKKRDGQ